MFQLIHVLKTPQVVLMYIEAKNLWFKYHLEPLLSQGCYSNINDHIFQAVYIHPCDFVELFPS